MSRPVVVSTHRRDEDLLGFNKKFMTVLFKHGHCSSCGGPLVYYSHHDVHCDVCHKPTFEETWLSKRVYQEAMAARLRREDFLDFYETLTLDAKRALLGECALRIAVESAEDKPGRKRILTALWVRDALKRRGGDIMRLWSHRDRCYDMFD